MRGGSSGHHYQRKFNIPILLIGRNIFLQHVLQVFVTPELTVAGVLASLFGGPTMGRSFLSFAVVLGGLDLPV